MLSPPTSLIRARFFCETLVPSGGGIFSVTKIQKEKRGARRIGFKKNGLFTGGIHPQKMRKREFRWRRNRQNEKRKLQSKFAELPPALFPSAKHCQRGGGDAMAANGIKSKNDQRRQKAALGPRSAFPRRAEWPDTATRRGELSRTAFHPPWPV